MVAQDDGLEAEPMGCSQQGPEIVRIIDSVPQEEMASGNIQDVPRVTPIGYCHLGHDPFRFLVLADCPPLGLCQEEGIDATGQASLQCLPVIFPAFQDQDRSRLPWTPEKLPDDLGPFGEEAPFTAAVFSHL